MRVYCDGDDWKTESECTSLQNQLCGNYLRNEENCQGGWWESFMRKQQGLIQVEQN